MTYTKEDREYIEKCLNNCIKIKVNDKICYVTNLNIIRQLKYNQLYNINKEIKYNKNKTDTILMFATEYNWFFVGYTIFSYFCDKYITNKNINQNLLYKQEVELDDMINDIFRDIFNLTNCSTFHDIE